MIGSKFAGVVATGALAGGASGAILTGSVQGALEGAAWGAVSAAAAFGVAELAGAMTGVDAHNATLIKGGQLSRAGFIKAIGHGLSRAAIAKAQYGTGKGAFLSAFVSSGFSVGADSKFGAIKMAIVGGTASVIGGGKFANGAMGSAFQYLFNDAITSEEIEEHNKKMLAKEEAYKKAFGENAESYLCDNPSVAKAVLFVGTAAYSFGRFVASTLNNTLYRLSTRFDRLDYDELGYYGTISGAVTGTGIGAGVYFGTEGETAKPVKVITRIEE